MCGALAAEAEAGGEAETEAARAQMSSIRFWLKGKRGCERAAGLASGAASD